GYFSTGQTACADLIGESLVFGVLESVVSGLTGSAPRRGVLIPPLHSAVRIAMAYLETIPEPWTAHHIQSAIMSNFQAARTSIDQTDGGKLWRGTKELDDTVWIFQASAAEVIEEIGSFGEKSKELGFWEKTNRKTAEDFVREVKRKLFYATSSVMALVEVARVFNKKWGVEGYGDGVKAHFSTLGLHEFLQDLRNYNAHWRIAEANWRIDYDFQGGRVARFVVDRGELLAWGNWKAGAKRFIEDGGTEIDIGAAFDTYRKQVKSFYEWHKGQVLEAKAPLLRTYLEYKRIHDGLNQQMKWNAILGHVPDSLNPYQYLSRYLSTAQMEKVLAFEHRSEAQIDALIDVLDMRDFCNAQLRAKVQKLFKPLTTAE
ncbi:hypothetical protein R4370_006691, partial [Pseudomonas putida]